MRCCYCNKYISCSYSQNAWKRKLMSYLTWLSHAGTNQPTQAAAASSPTLMSIVSFVPPFFRICHPLIWLNSCDWAFSAYGVKWFFVGFFYHYRAHETFASQQRSRRKEQVKAATSSHHCLKASFFFHPDRGSQNRKKNTNSCPCLSPLRLSSVHVLKRISAFMASLPLPPVGLSCPLSCKIKKTAEWAKAGGSERTIIEYYTVGNWTPF